MLNRMLKQQVSNQRVNDRSLPVKKYSVILPVLLVLLLRLSVPSYAQLPEMNAPVIAVTVDTFIIQFYALREDVSLEYWGELPSDFSFNVTSAVNGWKIYEGAVSPNGRYFSFSAYNHREEEPFQLFVYHFETAELKNYPVPGIYAMNWLQDSLVLIPSGDFPPPEFSPGQAPHFIFRLDDEFFTELDRYKASALFFDRFLGSLLITSMSPPECGEPCPAYRSELYLINQMTGAQRRLTNLPRLSAPEPFASVEQRGRCFSAVSQIYERIFINACAGGDMPPEYFFSIDLNGNVQDENSLRDLIGLEAFEPMEIWQTFERGWNFYLAVVTFDEGLDRLYLVRYIYPSGWEVSFGYEGTFLGERYLRGIQLSPDGRFILIQTHSEASPPMYQLNLEIFDIETGHAVPPLSYLTPNLYYAVSWLSSEQLVFTEADESGQMSITIFDVVENTSYVVPKPADGSYRLLPVGRSE